ncbi:MAG TPA: ChbG/HpnK family deacetylase [Azospira sp.]|nr:ChbG/HpnK family deacetylase [Azospira sp.]
MARTTPAQALRERTLDVARPARRLIVNADDLGIGAARDAGILELFAERAITSASLLVGGAHAAEAAAAAVAAGLPLGLHLNLSEGRALTPGTQAGADGLLRGKFGARAALAAGTVADADLAREIRAQFEAFIALTGELPSHVDGHHHLHVEPAVAAVLAPIMADEYGVYCVRLPRQPGLEQIAADAGPDFDREFHLAVAAAASAAAARFAAHGVYSTTAFLGQSLMGRRLQAEAMAAALRALDDEFRPTPAQPLTVELMVHPGHPASAEAGDFCRSPARAHEMAVLRSAAWREAIAGWQPGSFHELPRPGAGERPTILIYGKLTPATGNAETARRYAAAWSASADVRRRPLLADPADPAALAREVRRLRELAAREALDLAFGIHLYRAGAPLAAAFASATAHVNEDNTDAGNGIAAPLPFGLLASGTDANADLADPAKRAAIADAVGAADFLFCLSDDLRARLRDLALPADTSVLANGIDVVSDRHPGYSLRAALGLAPDARLVLFPAGLRRLKGVLPTVEALAAPLAATFRTHVLVILGPALEADYAQALRQRIDALVAAEPTLRGRLRVHDGLPRADYLAALREADLLLNASEHEGLSHALAEAMAAGVPVLARDIPGNRLLVRDGENGRLFAGFTGSAGLPAAYAACFDDAGATARMARQAQREMAESYPAAAEGRALHAQLERALTRRQTPLPFGRQQALRLDLAPGTHPLAADNVALFARIALSPAASARLPATVELAVDVGCGCGAFGLALVDALARHGRSLRRLLASDPHRPSLAALARTLTRHGGQLPMLATATLADGSLLTPLLARGERAALICANLPQTPGPAGFRADRYGGGDGAELLCALIAQLPAALADDGEAFLLHIGLAHPARVAATLAAHGLRASVLAEQTRHAALADYEALQAGLADYLLAEGAAGRARFARHGATISFAAQLLRVRRDE